MEKTGQMIEFEEETGGYAIVTLKVGYAGLQFPSEVYVEWLEAELLKASVKAAAYDRLMSGGKKTLKELANILGRVVVVNASGNVESFDGEPRIDLHYGFWYLNEDDEDYEDDRFLIPRDIVDFNGDWKDSLTFPDGWREK